MAEKSFTDAMGKNPAMSFISSAHPEKAQAVARGERALYSERKTRRLQLLLTQSLYDEMREEARLQGVSVNSLAAAFFKDGLEAARKKKG